MSSAGVVDSITENWPVPSEHSVAFQAVKCTHQIYPLPLYDVDDKHVPVGRVTSQLSGALVEVHFRLRHNYIKQGYNSFGGIIEQVVILKAGVPRVSSPYRNCNAAGPYRPKALPLPQPQPSRSEQLNTPVSSVSGQPNASVKSVSLIFQPATFM
ncbi:hypothetical protein H0H81_004042 [Sphagnurus paluster]|uniref:Uncharacterized protein n=1 Tax=Sphagnurus paluster TaxID=117069 RepID=A0A9P7K7A7_9AGAR|nr:hypothetical protein H0H81_004042 [Sphagnurus paluster]